MNENFQKFFDSLLVKEGISKSFLEHRSFTESSDFTEFNAPIDLSIYSFPKNVLSEKIGTHPDFEDGNLPVNQFICSIFLDIKGSTNLSLHYPLKTVQSIKNALITFGIKVIKYFGGHIHRIQGDAIFAFTGFRNIKKSDAIIQAINACSIIQYFNKKYLEDYFKNELGVDPLKIRIGIDFGDDDEVLWSRYGIENIEEISVTSIHADLASKLQHKAGSNSIILGHNAYNYLQIHTDLLDNVRNSKDEVISYIINRSDLGYQYGMKVFKWNEYLNRISHVDKDELMELRCYADEVEYFTNSSIDKDVSLKFKICASQFVLEDIKNVKWTVMNSGEEAKKVGKVSFDYKDAEDKLECKTKTSYNGEHFMKCEIKRKSGLKKILWFTIFINDNSLSKNYLKKIEYIGE